MDGSTRDAVIEGRGAADDHRALAWSTAAAAPADARHVPAPVILPGMGFIRSFAETAMTGSAAAAVAHVEQLRAAGFSSDVICLDLLAPCARRLGEWWVDDLCSFADVTIGCCNLQQALHAMGPQFTPPASAPGADGRSILLCPVPGEQHAFGLSMVAQFLRRAGWECACDSFPTRSALARSVRRRRVRVVGLSAACERHLMPLSDAITALRRGAAEGSVRVMVGGAAFAEHPEWAVEVGADGVATDGRDAVHQAEALLAMH